MNTQKNTRIMWWAIIIAGLALLVWGVIKLGTPNKGGQVSSTIGSQEWTKGNENAAVTMIEYSDFQCPACGTYYPLVKQLSEELGADLRVIYRNFPLTPIHPNAMIAAQAAEAAGAQNKFWEMHDILFEKQTQWSASDNPEDYFTQYATTLGLDVDQFTIDMKSKEVKKEVQNDVIKGNQDGVNATPSFFVNGEKITNPRSYNDFKDVILKKISSNQ